MVPSRLDKYMSDATSLSRSQIRKAWSDGKIEVCVGGEVEARVIALDTLIFEEDQVFFEQTRVERRVPSVYAAFCKPMGVISSARREKGQRSLAPWLEELGEGVFPIGRLEQDTVGLMLLTDDENFVCVREYGRTYERGIRERLSTTTRGSERDYYSY